MSALSKAFPHAVKEIRLHFSPTGSGSAGIRKFVQEYYPVMKQHNPNVPILLREATSTPARMFIRLERSVDLNAFEVPAIKKKFSEMLSQ
ncbi:hypothetical protein MVES1_000781 [Malassezia vespertilionis]|uniref:uncharacterized protein n=1 Tax=Malassezia vespertilionis TaxID=2020962 RepID=UPI0024B13E8F|nr:uncharacterized protein MVES1_000781 [Malassezia vespertilionis]WFD05451.1 hypothetical protein MVES1_000781 [Malassezia vespertilionis]